MAGNVHPGVRSGEIDTSCLPAEQPLDASAGGPAATTACRRTGELAQCQPQRHRRLGKRSETDQ